MAEEEGNDNFIDIEEEDEEDENKVSIKQKSILCFSKIGRKNAIWYK